MKPIPFNIPGWTMVKDGGPVSDYYRRGWATPLGGCTTYERDRARRGPYINFHFHSRLDGAGKRATVEQVAAFSEVVGGHVLYDDPMVVMVLMPAK